MGKDQSFLSLSKKGKAILVASLFLFILSGLGLYYIIFGPNWGLFDFINKESEIEIIFDSDEETFHEIDSLVCSDCSLRWLDGLSVASEKAEVFPIALVIDNDPGARPQYALAQASLVYEVPVEGGATRYLAIYPADIELEKVGPVRSARSYFVNLAEELKAAFLHVGGSPGSLEMIKNSSLYSLNEFYNESYFWRDYDQVRKAPHNVFTNSEKWSKYLDNRGLKERQVDSWLFKKENPSLEMSPDITLRFSANFQALWRYSQDDNEYIRFFNGREAWDDESQIKAKNIIIQKVKSEVIDELGRLRLHLEGAGEAVACLDGACHLASWKKEAQSRTRYYYQDGSEIRFNPGVTWIEIADNLTRIEY